MTKLSEHFTDVEFTCRSGELVPMDLLPNLRHLVSAVLEPLRVRWGAPLIVTCGYRSPTYNAALKLVSDERARRAGLPAGGVAAHSRHMTAEAADIRPVDLGDLPLLCSTVEEMLQESALPSLGGFGKYPNQWAHLDVRPGTPGKPVRWLGAGVGSESP